MRKKSEPKSEENAKGNKAEKSKPEKSK